MQTRYSFLLFSAFASVLYASKVLAVTCTATPECASLGYKYSQEECPQGGLKCPTGDSYYCSTPRPKCNIGDIFYTDNTCFAAANHNSSKTVLGIVVYVNANGIGGQIMAPWKIDKNGNRNSSGVTMMWGPRYTDVLELPNITGNSVAEADFDSCGNTDKIVAAEDASAFPAAWATRKYAPTAETTGKWCLPSAGVLRNITKNWNAINTAINAVDGSSDFFNDWVWSSTEYSSDLAWSTFLNNNTVTKTSKGNSSYVVPVLEF